MLRRILAIAGFVVADAKRRRTPYVVLLFAGVMAAAIPMLPSYSVGVIQAVYREVALAMVWVASLVLSLSLAAGRIPSEVERRTVFNVLSKDVRRWEYVVGTWLGLTVTVWLAIAAFTIVCQIVGLAIYGEAMFVLWQGAWGIALEMAVVLAVSVAVSCVIGPMVVVAVVALALFVGHSRATLVAEESPLWAYYPSLDQLVVINPVAHGSGISAVYAALMLASAAAWVVAALIVGSLAFSRRDL